MLPISVLFIRHLSLGHHLLLLIAVSVICCIVLQVLVEETVRLGDEEHELVEHFADHVLPILLVPLLLHFALFLLSCTRACLVFLPLLVQV